MIDGALSTASNYPALSASSMALAAVSKACTFANCFASAGNRPETSWSALEVGCYTNRLPIQRGPLRLGDFAKAQIADIDTSARPLVNTNNIVKIPLPEFDNPEAEDQVQG
ncbi:hypothetical protein [Glaciimonas sp. PCH181]|uniref:hypothetical protein n=1 Tax=Glaciimonas sp. PCH181 TaxID=2133943 RepID=UPI000D3C1EC3|nr:hypothetical protein [Glaciimonas sp. PCH181]PUA17796.1 hypothetical protein C7W93_18215 [Glaciimonas sp. PCH181]